MRDGDKAFLTRPGIVEGSEGGGTKRGKSRWWRDSRFAVCCENGGFEGLRGYMVRGEKGYWSRR